MRITADSFAQAVYTAMLTNPLDHRAGLDAVDRIGIGTTEHTDQLLKNHAVAYPAATPETVLEPLYPDRLAEDFLALMTAGHKVASFTPDPWTGEALSGLLSQPSEWQGTAMTVLVAAAARWPHVAARQLAPLLGARPELAPAGGGVTLAALSDIRQLDEATLSAVEQRLPAGSHPELNAGVLSLVQCLTDMRSPRHHGPAGAGTAARSTGPAPVLRRPPSTGVGDRSAVHGDPPEAWRAEPFRSWPAFRLVPLRRRRLPGQGRPSG
ncbi:hypothetical protein ACFP3U_31855 [Kitasatospora misakiensis]|uniref:Uncharacterized protein n=1 Tax=Kitasatospora misakiensis TaxID=67330 RepID=A0ABW0XCV9_9ACTN